VVKDLKRPYIIILVNVTSDIKVLFALIVILHTSVHQTLNVDNALKRIQIYCASLEFSFSWELL
jgi:hypothetical protein